MQRVLHNDHHGDAEYGYELTMMRNPLTTIDVRVHNQSDGCKLIYQDVEFDAGVLDLIITNVKNEEAYHKIPAPKSVEAKVLAEVNQRLTDTVSYDELDDYVDASDDCVVTACFSWLEEDGEYEVLEIDKSFEKDIADLKANLKEFYEHQVDLSVFSKLDEMSATLKNIKSLSEFDKVEVHDNDAYYSNYKLILTKSLDYGFEIELHLRVNSHELTRHPSLQDLKGAQFEQHANELKIDLSKLQFTIGDAERYRDDVLYLQNSVDEYVDDYVKCIYHNGRVTSNIGFGFSPNEDESTWNESNFESNVLIEKVED